MELAELKGSEKQIKWADKVRAAGLESIEDAGRKAPHFKEACDALAAAIANVSDSFWLIGSRYRLGLKVTKLYGTDELTIASSDLMYHQVFRDERFVRPGDRLGMGEIPQAEAQRIKEIFIAAQRTQLANRAR